jgi:glutathione S-transferase
MPRPDLEAIAVKYRRIPVMAIGRDVYCDTRLMLDKLEQLFPDGSLGASQPDQRAVQKLLEKWTIEAGIFARATQLIPTSMPLLNDPKFTKDREDFSGRSWDKEQIEAMRPEAIAHIRDGFSFLEKTLLADEREWILKTNKPSLADIEGKAHLHLVHCYTS